MPFDDKITDFVWNTYAGAVNLTSTIDRHAGQLATQVRDKITGRTPPPPPPPPPAPVSTTLYNDLTDWVNKNRWTAAVGLSVLSLSGFGAYSFLHHHRLRKPLKRRAKRASNGARKEVVVIAGTSGSIHDALTKSLATDLERRGFIVFMVVNSLDDEQMVLHNIGGRDIRPLHIDLLDPDSARQTVDKFAANLQSPVLAFPGAAPHQLHFAGMVVVAATADIPSQSSSGPHPTGPVETIAFSDWSDTLNLRLLSPFVTMQLFLSPLRNSASSRLIVLTPSIISSLAPPFHAPEAAAVAAIDAFSTTLRRELLPLGVHVSQLKLGSFDFSCSSTSSSSTRVRRSAPETAEGAQSAYAHHFTNSTSERAFRGSNLRELHHAVFDALTTAKPRKLVRVGSGSWVYEVVGRWAPDSWVMWMLGSGRKAEEEERARVVSRSASEESLRGSMTWEKV
ncbi:DUF1776-domain-containing protein [Ascodesmis nigricans]|uniref:DUF1776-domain-containing protein n=1 Tax=Ascodesmis nigricans TaxID=341454 RepID=A0A4S2MTF3_9PEZI|nr:DUF1776-domain-containing protein [Ascodesmis nigricans]